MRKIEKESIINHFRLFIHENTSQKNYVFIRPQMIDFILKRNPKLKITYIDCVRNMIEKLGYIKKRELNGKVIPGQFIIIHKIEDSQTLFSIKTRYNLLQESIRIKQNHGISM